MEREDSFHMRQVDEIDRGGDWKVFGGEEEMQSRGGDDPKSGKTRKRKIGRVS